MENQIVSNQELLVSNMLEIQALIRILKKKDGKRELRWKLR